MKTDAPILCGTNSRTFVPLMCAFLAMLLLFLFPFNPETQNAHAAIPSTHGHYYYHLEKIYQDDGSSQVGQVVSSLNNTNFVIGETMNPMPAELSFTLFGGGTDSENKDKPTLEYALSSTENSMANDSDIARIESYTAANETTVIRVTPLKSGKAYLNLIDKYPDGCVGRRAVPVIVRDDPFDIKSEYVLNVGGDPLTISYKGDKQGKIDIDLNDAHAPVKATISDDKQTLTIEAIRTTNEYGWMAPIKTWEIEKGTNYFSQYPNLSRTWPTIYILEAGEELPKPPTEKETKELNAQSMRAYTTLVCPVSIDTVAGAVTLGSASVNSSNPDIANATYTSGSLKITAQKAGTTTLKIQSDKALYDYTMTITVSAVPIKPENIKANNTGMKFSTMLGGKNVPDGAEAALEAKTVNSGSSYAALKQAATNDVIGVYSVNLGVDGKDVHDDFGTIDLTFPLPAEYTNATVRINHLHETAGEQFSAGEITSEIVPVVNGEATITVSDLSTFALESNTTSIADNTGSAINDTTNTAGNPGAGKGNQSTTQAGQSTGDAAKLSATGDAFLLGLIAALGIAVAATSVAIAMLHMRKKAPKQ